MQAQGAPVFLSPTSTIVCPRTMPSFACCAMQCAYALLMVHQKTKTVYPYSSVDTGQQQQQTDRARPLVVNSLLVRLQQGLTSIYGTLANYATAFEALGGMRGEFALPGVNMAGLRSMRANLRRPNSKCSGRLGSICGLMEPLCFTSTERAKEWKRVLNNSPQ